MRGVLAFLVAAVTVLASASAQAHIAGAELAHLHAGLQSQNALYRNFSASSCVALRTDSSLTLWCAGEKTEGGAEGASDFSLAAFGELEEHQGDSDVSHLFAGEQLDPNTGFYYNRARWMNPSNARFLTMDTWNGRCCEPATLHKYNYAQGNPISNTDPTGHMSLGEIGSALNVQGTLQNLVRYELRDYFGSRILGDDETVDSQPSLFDLALATIIKAAAGMMPVVAGISVVAPVGGKTEAHHSIPKYMCGHKEQELVDLPKPQHNKLHNELYVFETTVRATAIVFDLIFRKRQKGEKLSPIAKAAKTSAGRAAIATGLTVFYESYGDGGASWADLGRGQKSKAPLGAVLAKETVRFVGTHHKYPKCPR